MQWQYNVMSIRELKLLYTMYVFSSTAEAGARIK